jgi:hypothetical protein
VLSLAGGKGNIQKQLALDIQMRDRRQFQWTRLSYPSKYTHPKIRSIEGYRKVTRKLFNIDVGAGDVNSVVEHVPWV